MSNYTITKINKQNRFEIILFNGVTPVDHYHSYAEVKVNRIYDRWKRDFQATDVSPGNPTAPVSVGAASFDSALSQRLIGANWGLLSPSPNKFSISALAYITNTTLPSSLVSKWNATGNQREYLLSYAAGASFQWRISWDGSAANPTTSTVPIIPNTWYHVVGVWDKINQTIYVGNAPVSTNFAGVASTVFPGTGRVNVGGVDTPGSFANGRIARVRFWDYDLSLADINALINGGVSQIYAQLSAAQKSHVLAAWDLGEGAGTTRKDSTSNGFDLTDSNGVSLAAGPP